MTHPAILGLATGVPALRMNQSDIYAQFQALGLAKNRRVRDIFERIGVGFRYAAVDHTYYTENHGTEARNQRYLAEALPLGEATIQRCLNDAGLAPDDIDDFLVVSCTGLTTPGLDLHLAGRLGMRHDLRRTSIIGMGCYAAFPALLRARESTALKPGRKALVLCLELCSLHLQFDDSLENMVASALFSDGAAAVIVGTHNEHAPRGPMLIDSATQCDYTTLDHMAFVLTDHGFRMHLSAYVPDVLAAHIETFVDGLLARNGLCREQVRLWGVHPGSSKILDYVQERIGLSDAQMDFSRRILWEYGNMSSPTILFVLDEIRRCAEPRAGDYGVLLAFGPGLTMEGALVRW